MHGRQNSEECLSRYRMQLLLRRGREKCMVVKIPNQCLFSCRMQLLLQRGRESARSSKFRTSVCEVIECNCYFEEAVKVHGCLNSERCLSCYRMQLLLQRGRESACLSIFRNSACPVIGCNCCFKEAVKSAWSSKFRISVCEVIGCNCYFEEAVKVHGCLNSERCLSCCRMQLLLERGRGSAWLSKFRRVFVQLSDATVASKRP